jgi:Skp family chaperone for outer membrane proteins
MTRYRAATYFVGLAATGILGATAVAQSIDKRPQPLLVGIVDLGVVLARYHRTADIGREVEREKGVMESRARQQKRNIDALSKEIEGMPEGTELYREKVAELKLEQKALEAMNAEVGAIAKQRFDVLTLTVIDEIEEGVREFARRNRYDMILKTTTKGWGESGLPERIYRAQVSTVVAYDTKLDVTEAIVEQLNDPESLKKRTGLH